MSRAIRARGSMRDPTPPAPGVRGPRPRGIQSLRAAAPRPDPACGTTRRTGGCMPGSPSRTSARRWPWSRSGCRSTRSPARPRPSASSGCAPSCRWCSWVSTAARSSTTSTGARSGSIAQARRRSGRASCAPCRPGSATPTSGCSTRWWRCGTAPSRCSSPARSSIYPRILERDLLPAANALSVFAMNASMTVGPLLAGVLVDWGGFKAAYTADAVITTAALWGLARLPSAPARAARRALRRPGRGCGRCSTGSPS